MEIPYRFYKAYLFRPGCFRDGNPCAAAEITIRGRAGQLNFFVGKDQEVFSSPKKDTRLVLQSPKDSVTTVLGKLEQRSSGSGISWNFNTVSAGSSPGGNKEMVYRLRVVSGWDTEPEKVDCGRVIMEGIVLLPEEIRDCRVVKFNKEGKDKRSNPGKCGNPLFERVEPFEPPIPNASWWRISLQPDPEKLYLNDGFCPRKKNRAIF
ncbi:MAG: hypothetical protein CVU89_09190 [Firmicutes bacterium HGW-Firmicutes-14]|nr:MAG: hypothetical protein CVU89_09190 [Firmicutes bacterium HGW-Firmicutes-14]